MRVVAVMLRIFQQFKHDKRTIALMIIAPMFVLTLLLLIFEGNDYEPQIALVSPPPGMTEKLESLDVEVSLVTSSEGIQKLQDNQIDAVVDFSREKPQFQLEGSDPNINRAVLRKLQQWIQTPNPSSASMDIIYLHGSSDLSSFDYMGPVFIGIFIFFFVFLISGISFLRERTSGTLERLLATSIRRWELIVGYIFGFGLFSILQSAIISLYCVYVLGIPLAGSLLDLIVITVLMALCALSIGTLVSSFAENELQVMQFIPIIIVPQILFSGLFQLDTMSPYLKWMSWVMPIFYGSDALREVMIKGHSWSHILDDLTVLTGMTILLIAINIRVLKRYRKI